MGERSRRDRLNLNRCTAAGLSAVAGIGLDKANRIVAYRRRKQRFSDMSDVLNVRGVTKEDLHNLRQTCSQIRRSLNARTAATPRPKKTVPKQTAERVSTPKPNAKTSGQKARPGTSRKGTQTIVTGASVGRKMTTIAARKKRSGALLPRGKNLPNLKKKKKKKPTERTGKVALKAIRKTATDPMGFSSPAAKRRKSSPASLLMCLEAQRLKASEGLDYGDSYGSPRPVLAVSNRAGAGERQARAQIDNCAVTVHLPARAPLMSPMVTVNIPSSVPRREYMEVVGRNVWRKGCAAASPGPDTAISLDTMDHNNSNNVMEKELTEEEEVGGLRKVKAFEEGPHQEGYLAGSDTDYTSPHDVGDDRAASHGPPLSINPASPTDEVLDGNSAAQRDRNSAKGSGEDQVTAHLRESTGARRRTRSRKRTAEKVQLWLENSSCSSGRRDPDLTSLVGGEKNRVADESGMSGVAPLPLETPVEDGKIERELHPALHEPQPGCKRQLDPELSCANAPLTPAEGAGRKDKSVQTPPCSCRSCRRGRRAATRSGGEARARCEPPGVGDSFTPAAAAKDELKPVWCLLL